MNIITGEKLQLLCNYYIGTNRDFAFSRSQRYKETDKTIYIDDDIIINKFLNIINENNNNNILLIFIYTDMLRYNLDKVIYILSNINSKFNLIIHNSDYSFNDNHLVLLKLKNINKIFTQNINVSPTNNLIPLPIGIANSQWSHGCLNCLNKVIKYLSNYKKDKLIYFYFKINTNKKLRQDCYDKIIKSKYKIINIPKMEYTEYLKCLANHKYAICPEGNGIDTHRFWECLYLKVIPICKKNYITRYYKQFFPIKLVNDWDDIDDPKFNIFKYYNRASWNNYNLLNFSHYKNIISK